MLIRSALCWDITQRRVVIPYRRFGATCWAHLQGSKSKKKSLDFLTDEDGADTLSRNVGKELPTRRCGISQKGADVRHAYRSCIFIVFIEICVKSKVNNRADASELLRSRDVLSLSLRALQKHKNAACPSCPCCFLACCPSQ
jgi:hypothetical protein